MSLSKREQKQHSLFMRRTLSLRNNMKARYKRLGCTGGMPITIEIVRDFVQEALDLDPVCTYCLGDITHKNFSMDHMTPIERGGSWAGSNLEVICKSCNTAKGRMTADEFQSLMGVLDTFPEAVKRETLGRLKAGASIIRLQFLGKRSKQS